MEEGSGLGGERRRAAGDPESSPGPTSVLVSYGYSSKRPQGYGLTTTQIDPLTVPEARGSRAAFLLEALGENLPPCPFQRLETPVFCDLWPLPPSSEPQA